MLKIVLLFTEDSQVSTILFLLADFDRVAYWREMKWNGQCFQRTCSKLLPVRSDMFYAVKQRREKLYSETLS